MKLCASGKSKQMLNSVTTNNPDLCAGMALLKAALGAGGKNIILNIPHINQCYQYPDSSPNDRGEHSRSFNS